jgi:hypothetical protein
MNKILFLLPALVFQGLAGQDENAIGSQPKISQGLEGYVYRISGNQMPSPNAKPHPLKGISTGLYIYVLTGLDQVERVNQSAFYSHIHSKYIGMVMTDSNGFFRIALPSGKYSLFVKKDSLFYANLFDQHNHINPAEVFPGKISRIEFRMDFDASY